MRHRISRLLVAGFLLSLLFHFGVAPLLVWLFGYHPTTPKTEVVYVATSSSIRRAARPRPRPPRRVQHPPVPKPVTQTHQQQQKQKPQPQRPEVKREIARVDLHSVHPPPAHAVDLNAQVQQQVFEKTIARLREQNDPVVSAARATVAPAAPKQFSFDFSGVGTSPTAEGILTPEKRWYADGYDYYYVRYWVQYADGSTETGVVPWPLRYRPAEDPFRLGMEHFPLPGPMADFELPPGTSLHPLVAFCYKHRTEFPNCPIERE